MKKCKQCELEKEDSEFRTRTETSTQKCGVRSIYRYLYMICKQCEKENQYKYYLANHDLCLEKSKAYQKANRDIQNVKQRHRRFPNGKITGEHSAYLHKYYLKNKERILNGHKPVARKSFIYQRDNLTDWYVIMLATQKRGGNPKLTKEDFKKYPELIELYRKKIKLTRANRSDKFKISSKQIKKLRQKLDERRAGVFESQISDSGYFIIDEKKEAAWRKKLAKYRLEEEKAIDIPTFGS